MTKQRKGFNVMDPKLVKAIASLGGQASQRLRRGHRWSPQEARMHRQAQLAKARERELEGLYTRVRERAAQGPPPSWYECGGCGGYHPRGFDGDCREDAKRWP